MRSECMKSECTCVFAISLMLLHAWMPVMGLDFMPKGKFTQAGQMETGCGVYIIGEERIMLSTNDVYTFEKAKSGDSSAQYEFAKVLNPLVGRRESTMSTAAEAFAWAMRSALQCNADGENFVGLCYRYGEGVSSNSQESVRWLVKAVRHGSAKAKCNLAEHFIDEGNLTNAFVLARSSAEDGFCRGQVLYGKMLLTGQGTHTNKKLAATLFKKAATQGDPAALCLLAVCHQRGDGMVMDKNEAIRMYGQVAKQTNSLLYATLAKSALACIYMDDKTAEGKQKALEWAESALRRTGLKELKKAKKESIIALLQCYVGKSLRYGWGGEKNVKRARQYLQESGDNGNVEAIHELIDGYEMETFDENAKFESFELWMRRSGIQFLRKAADKGNALAQDAMGMAYWSGIGVQGDRRTAFEWYQKAASKHYPDALLHLARCYRNGDGIEQNYAMAARYWREAAEAGIAVAQHKLACCYQNGEGTEQSLSNAAHWFQKAAEQNYVNSQYELGMAYGVGKGVNQDYEKARFWLQKALEGGNEDAQTALDEMSTAERRRIERERKER